MEYNCCFRVIFLTFNMKRYENESKKKKNNDIKCKKVFTNEEM